MGRALVSAGFSLDGMRIFTASQDGAVRVWNANGTGEPVVLRGAAAAYRRGPPGRLPPPRGCTQGGRALTGASRRAPATGTTGAGAVTAVDWATGTDADTGRGPFILSTASQFAPGPEST